MPYRSCEGPPSPEGVSFLPESRASNPQGSPSAQGRPALSPGGPGGPTSPLSPFGPEGPWCPGGTETPVPITERVRGTCPLEPDLNCGQQVGGPCVHSHQRLGPQGIHVASELGEQGVPSPRASSTPVRGHPPPALPGLPGALTWQTRRSHGARLHKCLQRVGQR